MKKNKVSVKKIKKISGWFFDFGHLYMSILKKWNEDYKKSVKNENERKMVKKAKMNNKKVRA